MNILVIAEHDNKILNPSTYSAISAAAIIENKLDNSNQENNIDLLLAGSFDDNNINSLSEEVQKTNLINQLLISNNKLFEHGLAEYLTDLIKEIAVNYDYVLMAATTYGKNIAPRVAACLDINMLSDVTEIIEPDIFKRFIFAGNAVATIKLKDKIKLLTVRTTCFNLNNLSDISSISESTQKDLSISNLDYNNNEISHQVKTKYISDEFSKSEHPDLATAKIVVSGGRGLQNKENFALIEQLADKLNAAVGASRAAVDAGYVANDYQVGQTGKVVAPDLYIAVGISGAIQHIAGINDSKVIVAINKDPDAPIFNIADYGLVGDLFTIVPKLIELL